MRRLAFLPLLFSALAIGGCGSSAEINYRIIVQVDDNGVSRTGSGVWQFKITENVPLGGRSYTPRFRGEAIAVDLPGRGTLFVLGQGPSADMSMVAEKLFRKEAEAVAGPAAERHQLNGAISKMVGQQKEVPCARLTGEAGDRLPLSFCPFLVRFRNPRDPGSVEQVDIANLSSSFGPGVRMKTLLVQITDADVTTGIEARLPWLAAQMKGKASLDGTPFNGINPSQNEPTGRRLSAGEFSTEISRK